MRIAWKTIAYLAVIILTTTLVVFAMNYRVSKSDVHEPERYVTYQADAKDGPRFSLNEDETRLRFLTYLHIPRIITRSIYDPEQKYFYDLVIEVFEAGEVIHEHRVRMQTVKTKRWDPVTERVSQPSFYPVGIEVGEPADLRIVDVDFSNFAGVGRSIRVRVGDDNSVSLLAFREFERLPETIARQVRFGTTTTRQEIANRLGVASSLLADDELAKALEVGWRRKTTLVETRTRLLYAIDTLGQVFETQTLGRDVEPGTAMTFYIRGPATVSVVGVGAPDRRRIEVEQLRFDDTWAVNEAAEEPERTPFERTQRSLNVPIISFARASRPAVRQSESEKIEVPAGSIQSITLRTNQRTRLVTWVDTPDAFIGETPFQRIGTGQWLIQPDEKRIKHWAASAGLTFTTEAAGVKSGDAALVKVIRTQVDPATLQYNFVGTDVSGELLSDAPLSELDVVAVDEEQRRVSDPSVFKIPIPDGARALVLSSTNENVWVTVSMLDLEQEATPIRDPAYPDPPDALTWRHGPYISYPWNRVLPDDVTQFEVDGKFIELVGQVRLEAKRNTSIDFSDGVEDVVASYSTLSVNRSVDLWEATDDASASWFEIEPNREVRCKTTSDFSVRVFSEKGRLGSSLSLYWNDRLIRRNVLRTESTTAKIRATSDGVIRVELKGDSTMGRAKLFVQCRPSSPISAWRVWSASRGKKAIVSVPHGEGKTTWLNAVVYADAQELEIESRVDGGDPPVSKGPTDRLFRATRNHTIRLKPARVFITTSPFREIRHVGRIGIPIGSNWAPGRREVSLKRGEGKEMWVRFFVRSSAKLSRSAGEAWHHD